MTAKERYTKNLKLALFYFVISIPLAIVLFFAEQKKFTFVFYTFIVIVGIASIIVKWNSHSFEKSGHITTFSKHVVFTAIITIAIYLILARL
jgi:hypothetical protein